MNDQPPPRQAAYKETGDLAFAAYAHMNGLKIVRAKEWRRGNSLEFQFAFDDPPSADYPDGRWDQFHIDFANSEAARFDSSLRSLKKICRRNSKGPQ